MDLPDHRVAGEVADELSDQRTWPPGRAHLVCGMHRSGTSMVAAMLRACGVHMGEGNDLVPPAADNPRGFGEHRQVVHIDDRLLASLCGAWDLPPAELERVDWWAAERLGGLRDHARRTLAGLASGADGGHWGMKDPRLSLTLPFWRSLLGDHRVVVCVRNPLEVAASLVARNGCSPQFALELWEAHHRRLDEELPTTHRLVVHYAAVLADPAGQIDRLAAALELGTVDGAAVAGAVDRGDRHHRFGWAELRHVGVPDSIIDRYMALCEEAGWQEPPTATGAPPPAAAAPGSPLDPDALERVTLEAQLQVRGGHIAILHERVEELEEELAARPAVEVEAAQIPPRRTGAALVVQHRLPEYDRERGSVRVLEVVDALVDAGWRVDFWALDVDESALVSDDDQRRYAQRLLDRGVAVHAGDANGPQDLIDAGTLDVCIAAFWHVASRVLPEIRRRSPGTRCVVDSIDLHLLRESRRLLDRLAPAGLGSLSAEDGERMVAELNVYAGADAVLTVSEREAQLVDEFVGRPGLGLSVPLGDPIEPSALTEPSERSGLVFVGNFRHLPNIEAVGHLVAGVLPRMDPDLLGANRVSVVGNGLDERVREVGSFPSVDLMGWVPDVTPHLHHARVSVVPLLHGAGVKGKVIQSLLAGTPVVSTPVGVEGLDLPDDGVAPVVVALGDADFARAVTRLLTDDDAWRAHRDAGLAWARAQHGPDRVARAVLDAVDLDRLGPAGTGLPSGEDTSRRWLESYEQVRAGVRRDLAAALPRGATVMVASGGDDDMVESEHLRTTHFPGAESGTHLGWNPSGAELVARLDAANRAGWNHLVLPATQLWWLHCHPELVERLDRATLVHDGDDCRIWDLGEVPLLVHVDPLVQDPDVAEAHLRQMAAVSTTDVVHMPVDLSSVPASPPLTQQVGVHGRTMLGLGSGPAVAARGSAAVAALEAALGGDPTELHRIPASIDDAHPVHLFGPVVPSAAGRRARIVGLVDADGVDHDHSDDIGGQTDPGLSIVIATRDRAELLDDCLASLLDQVLDHGSAEVVVVDDGSVDRTSDVVERWAPRLSLRHARLPGCGRSAAKNLGLMLARGDLVLLLDDDDRLLPGALRAYLASWNSAPEDERPRLAILGHTDWAPELELTPLMRHVTEVGCQLFSYPSLEAGVPLDWRHFWEGRLLVTRDLLVNEALHDQRLEYSIDVELARRLDRAQPVTVRYAPDARGVMARSVDLDSLAVRARAKGRAQRLISELHPEDAVLRGYCEPAPVEVPLGTAVLAARAAEVRLAACTGTDGGTDARADLDGCYSDVLRAATAEGFGPMRSDLGHGDPESGERPDGATATTVATAQPELSVVVPVWSLTPELAEMAAVTLRRVREVMILRTEIIVIDNGSPHTVELDADRVVTLAENRGVGPAWNLGASVAASPLLCFLNSDCTVQPGWDRALAHAASDGRRIAFPHTDHGDHEGHRRPDQAGTAGWCFVLHRDLFAEVGGFDESFAPAYFEDTDYWHRAWEMGVDLSPVPAALVDHERRTTGRHAPELAGVFTRNRRYYEAKHGVPFDAAPPYYHREVVEYPPPGRHRMARLRPWASVDDDRPRVFGIGMNKTGTSSLHAAVSHLGYRSVHHGDAALRAAIEAARDQGRPMLADVDQDLDAVCDIAAITDGFVELDRCYPGSKFVLTVRELDAWVTSRVRHVENNRRRQELGLEHGDFLEVDIDAWIAEGDRHHDAVLSHFAGRPDDLLVIDLCAGQGWERLAPFLGWGRLPERTFPWENRTVDLDAPTDRLAPTVECQ